MTDDVAVQVRQLTAQIRNLTGPVVTRTSLIYFNIIGICWPIRCLLHMKDIDYELIQVSIQQWFYIDSQGKQPLRTCFRNGHLPLYVDGEVNLGQSNLIMMHLGEKHDLIGDNHLEKLAAMEVMAHAYDFEGLVAG